MPAIEPLCSLIGVNKASLSKEESFLLEAELFIRIYEELKKYQKSEYKDYFRSIKLTNAMEDSMLEMNFVRAIIKDILATEEYTIEGIAQYTDTHQDVVEEVVTGLNSCPSAIFVRKAIELHRSVRKELYDMIMKKVMAG